MTHQTMPELVNGLGEDQDPAQEQQVVKREEALKIRQLCQKLVQVAQYQTAGRDGRDPDDASEPCREHESNSAVHRNQQPLRVKARKPQ